MSVFHAFENIQMVPNRAKLHIYKCAQHNNLKNCICTSVLMTNFMSQAIKFSARDFMQAIPSASTLKHVIYEVGILLGICVLNFFPEVNTLPNLLAVSLSKEEMWRFNFFN